MKKVVEFLQANPVQYLATVGRDGKAKCIESPDEKMIRQIPQEMESCGLF